MNEIPGNIFIEEATDLLNFLESGLLELEQNPDDNQLVAKVFRAMHTIKGSSGMFGYENIASFTHCVESVFDKIRNGELRVNSEIIDLSLKAVDIIKAMLKGEEGGSEAEEQHRQIRSAFEVIAGQNNTGEPSYDQVLNQEASGNSVNGSNLTSYRIVFQPASEIFITGTNLTALLSELKSLGEYRAEADLSSIPPLTDINEELCYIKWDIHLTTQATLNDIKDVFIFVEDICKIEITEIHDAMLNNIAINDLASVECTYSVTQTASGNVQESTLQKSTAGQNARNSGSTKNNKKTEESSASIRVNSVKLDELVNLVGELVTLHARLTGVSNKLENPELNSITEETERITWSLREGVLNLRMVPVSSVFSRFQRLVRDLSAELKKEVDFSLTGGETEMDKNMIERLNDPLVHIIRNCIDHGIELPGIRKNLGKSDTGHIKISAMHSGASVLIEISDDGAGLDKELIVAKAILKGLIPQNSELSDEDAYRLIMMPGFSTSDSVTSISGRGVGMDVVKRTIEELKGSIDIKSSKGTGTKITLKLPLTLAIIEGLLVRIDEEHFVIPLSSVEECIELQRKDKHSRRNLVNVRDELVPYVSLREMFSINSSPPDIEQIVIIRNNNFRTGLAVDKVVGSHQTVIKSLGRFYRNVEYLSGATLLGEGNVALILDVGRIIEEAEMHERKLVNRK